MTTPLSELYARLCTDEVADPGAIRPGRYRTRQGPLSWGREGIALRDVRFASGDLVSVQLSQSTSLEPTRVTGRKRRARQLLHLELRGCEGARLRLTAPVPDGVELSVPVLERCGVRVDASTLAAIAMAARRLGAAVTRFEPSVLDAERDDTHVLTFCDDRAAAGCNDRWGFVNGAGEWAIEPCFDEARAFSEGAAAVREGDRWGYIDIDGKWLHPPTLRAAGQFWGGVAPVTTGEGVNGGLYANGVYSARAARRSGVYIQGIVLTVAFAPALAFSVGFLALVVDMFTTDEPWVVRLGMLVLAAAMCALPIALARTAHRCRLQLRGWREGRPTTARSVRIPL